MTGAGTQADPYVPENWSDFITAAGTSGAYVKFADDTVWDLNDLGGIIGSVNIKATHIDGNGAVIKNLMTLGGGYCFSIDSTYNSNTTGGHYPRMLDNFIFENVYIADSSAFLKYSNGASGGISDWMYPTIVNCQFSGVVADSCFFYHNTNSPTTYVLEILSCSFNLRFIGNSTLVYRANPNFNISILPYYADFLFSGAMSRDANGAQVWAMNSRFTGDWAVNNLTVGGSSYESPYNVFNVTVPSGYTLTATSGATITKNLVNSTKISGTVGSAFTQVTDSQLQDASYLASIGFPIATGV